MFGRPDELPIDEGTPVQPTDAYGESMYLVERMLPWLNRAYGLSYVILHYSNAVGAKDTSKPPQPGRDPVARALQKAQEERTTTSTTEDNATPNHSVRDYLHVLDVAEAHVSALELLREGEARAYNLGNERGFADEEVLEACRRVVEGVPLVPEPPTSLVPVVDSSRARWELGWRPSRSTLEAIVTSVWTWYQKYLDEPSA